MSNIGAVRRIARRREAGATLIEGMVAILIFTLGILAIVGLHATSIRNTTEAQYRSEASYLVSGLIARMRLHDQGTVATAFASPNGTQYTRWLADLAAADARLPGMDANPPTVVFNGRQVTVTLSWRAQSDSAPRRLVVDTQLD